MTPLCNSMGRREPGSSIDDRFTSPETSLKLYKTFGPRWAVGWFAAVCCVLHPSVVPSSLDRSRPILRKQRAMLSRKDTMPHAPTVIDHAAAPSAATAATVKAAFMAGALALVLLYGMGFAPMEALHNAAHDGRHSAGFPCH